jgi:hypothetical protein
MSFLDSLIPGSRRHRIFAEEFDSRTVRCVDLHAVNFSPATIDTTNIECETLEATTSVTSPTINTTNVLAPAGFIQSSSMLTNTIVANTSVQSPTVNTSVVNTGSVVASGDVSGATLTAATHRGTTYQGIGAGTPQATLMRVATLGDPAQKVNNVWANNIGTSAQKTGQIHALNLNSNNVTTDVLSVQASPIFANAGIQMNGYVVNNWYREDTFVMSLYSGFLNSTYDIASKVYGIQGQFTMHTREFLIKSSEMTGNDDAFYMEVPYLQSYQMSGTIQFSTSNDQGAYNLAIVFKEVGASTITIAPLNFRHFQYGQYAGQDMYFKEGHIFCTEY